MTLEMERYFAERGLLMVAARKRFAIEPSSDPVGLVMYSLVEQIDAIIRPTLSEAVDADDLDFRINELLFNDSLINLFLQLSRGVSISGLEDVGRSAAAPNGLEALVGRLLAQQIAFFTRATARATASFIAWSSSREDGGAPDGQPPTGAWPKLYMTDSRFPPELKRALAGRDIGQIAYVGLVNAHDWALPSKHVVELCERFIANQSNWLEFLSLVPGVLVDSDALPKTRTRWREVFERARIANEAFDSTVQYMKQTGEKVHFYLDSEHRTEGSHEHS